MDIPDAPMNDQALEDQSEEEFAKKELQAMAIVEEKVAKKKPPKNLKKDRKPRTRQARKERNAEFFAARDAENVDEDGAKFVKGEGGLPPEQGQSLASKVLAEELQMESSGEEPMAPPPEPEPIVGDID